MGSRLNRLNYTRTQTLVKSCEKSCLVPRQLIPRNGIFYVKNTTGEDYTQRLIHKSGQKWKKILDVQAPYRWNLHRLKLGYTLDVGCGIGRNLKNLNGHCVGVDHNHASVEVAKSMGFQAFTSDDFRKLYDGKSPFDSILISHVVEHMTLNQAKDMIASYKPYLKSNGKIVLITPQMAGYMSDPTHVEFFDSNALAELLTASGFKISRSMSFPFPKFIGSLFKYNEFVVIATRT